MKVYTQRQISSNKLQCLCLLGILTLLTVSNVSYASSEFDCLNGRSLSLDAGKTALLELDRAYQGLNKFSTEFRQEAYLAALESSETSQGRLTFLRPGKMRWDYLEPQPQLFLADGQTFWFYQPEQNQVFIDKLSDTLSGELPISFLMGIGELSRDFSLIKACTLPAGRSLHLKPKQDNPSIESIKFIVDKISNLPKIVEVEDRDGNRNTFYFGAFDSKAAVSDNDFKANFPKGADLIDRRKD